MCADVEDKPIELVSSGKKLAARESSRLGVIVCLTKQTSFIPRVQPSSGSLQK